MSHSEEDQWESHHHQAIVHTHSHYHVTHNFNDMTGGFDHLSSQHSHEHDHPEVTHSHYPHQNFENEHVHEAHIHDHDVPVRRVTKAKAEGAAGTAKKRTSTRKATTTE
ncbi:MAG TPA: hypothetical protein VND22_04295 [Actinomycetota bacterium]|nr:hypothetical protein [Actinomycetota bacterium]